MAGACALLATSAAVGPAPVAAAPVLVPVTIDGGNDSVHPVGSRWSFRSGANAGCFAENNGFAVQQVDVDRSSNAAPGTGDNVLTDGLMLFDPAAGGDGLLFEPSDTVDVGLSGPSSTLTTSSVAFGGLDVSLQHTVFQDANRMRSMYTFSNPTGSPVTHTYQVRSRPGSGVKTGARGTSSGDATWDPADRWLVTSDAASSPALVDAALTTVLHGPGAGAQQPAAVSYSCFGPNSDPGTGRQVTTWDVTVPANSARSLVLFSEVHTTNEAALSAAAATYDAPTFATSPLFAGLTSTQLDQVLNWDVGAAPSTAFHPVVPYRVLDSRSSTGGWAGTKLGSGETRPLTVAGTGGAQGVPIGASAVVLNVTATNASAGSFVTAFPAGTARPAPSNLNFGAYETIPNLVTGVLGSGGALSFFNAVGSVDLVADVVGYFDDGSGPGDLFNGIDPTRVLDSRSAVGDWNGTTLGPGPTNARDLVVRGPGTGVPATATSVVLNVTATNSSANSFLAVWPKGAAAPITSNLNFAAFQTIANLVTVQIGTADSVRFLNANGSTDVIADVVGYFDPTAGGGRFHPIDPVRIQDSRPPNAVGPYQTPWGPTPPNPARLIQVGGAVPSIPANATGVIMNVTVTGGTVGSLLKVFPQGSAEPESSTLNFAPYQTIPNLVMTSLPATGQLAVTNRFGNVHVIGDVAGFFAPT